MSHIWFPTNTLFLYLKRNPKRLRFFCPLRSTSLQNIVLQQNEHSLKFCSSNKNLYFCIVKTKKSSKEETENHILRLNMPTNDPIMDQFADFGEYLRQEAPGNNDNEEADMVAINITKILTSDTMAFNANGFISPRRHIFYE